MQQVPLVLHQYLVLLRQLAAVVVVRKILIVAMAQQVHQVVVVVKVQPAQGRVVRRQAHQLDMMAVMESKAGMRMPVVAVVVLEESGKMELLAEKDMVVMAGQGQRGEMVLRMPVVVEVLPILMGLRLIRD
jgi:uncharacterized protein with ATP-grasp and redox domains